MDAHPATTLACRFALGVAGLRDMLIAHLIRTDYALPFLVFLWLGPAPFQWTVCRLV